MDVCVDCRTDYKTLMVRKHSYAEILSDDGLHPESIQLQS